MCFEGDAIREKSGCDGVSTLVSRTPVLEHRAVEFLTASKGAVSGQRRQFPSGYAPMAITGFPTVD